MADSAEKVVEKTTAKPEKVWQGFDGEVIHPDDLLRRLEERVQGEGAEGWRPQPGDTVSGIVTEIDEGSSEFGDDYPLLVIRRADGKETAVHCFHTVLRNRVGKMIDKGRLREGDLIAIRYIGPGTTDKKGMSAPELYRVSVQQ